ncbi:MAG: helix-turn-helix transcriptional regulator [Cyanobacteria bacterium J06635_10]
MDTQSRQKLVEIIKLARGSLSQRAFSKQMGVSSTSVQMWEKGAKVPDTANLVRIAVQAGYTLEELLCCLEGKPIPEATDLSVILRQLSHMPLSEVAIVGKAAMDRLAVAAESTAKRSES